MIEALKSDEIADKMGGRFKLCALIQRRLVQLMQGARPLVDRNGRSDLELVIEEIMQGKITYEFDPTVDLELEKIQPERAIGR
jgi:DNA-directed RNA polymerase subunit omega